MKKALVCGAGGFIGGHLVKKLKKEGNYLSHQQTALSFNSVFGVHF